MSKPYKPFANIIYCGAKARSTGKPCRGSAMKNGKCRVHGGASTGRPITTGLWTKQAVDQKKRVSSMLQQSRYVLDNS